MEVNLSKSTFSRYFSWVYDRLCVELYGPENMGKSENSFKLKAGRRLIPKFQYESVLQHNKIKILRKKKTTTRNSQPENRHMKYIHQTMHRKDNLKQKISINYQTHIINDQIHCY